MSKHSHDENPVENADPVADAEVFEAVAEAAGELDLELDPHSRIDKRMVGVFAAAVAHSSDSDGEGQAAGSSDDNAEIEAALQGWAETHPSQVVNAYGDFTTDPYVAVFPAGVKTITKEYLVGWIGSPEYKEILSIWSPKDDRETELSNIQIVHLSEYVASATFQGRELGKGEVPVIANGAAILVKDDSGQGKTAWKIAAVSKYGALE